MIKATAVDKNGNIMIKGKLGDRIKDRISLTPSLFFYIYDHLNEEALMVKDKSDFMHWLNDYADMNRYSFFSTQEKMESYLGKVLEEIKE